MKRFRNKWEECVRRGYDTFVSFSACPNDRSHTQQEACRFLLEFAWLMRALKRSFTLRRVASNASVCVQVKFSKERVVFLVLKRIISVPSSILHRTQYTLHKPHPLTHHAEHPNPLLLTDLFEPRRRRAYHRRHVPGVVNSPKLRGLRRRLITAHSSDSLHYYRHHTPPTRDIQKYTTQSSGFNFFLHSELSVHESILGGSRERFVVAITWNTRPCACVVIFVGIIPARATAREPEPRSYRKSCSESSRELGRHSK